MASSMASFSRISLLRYSSLSSSSLFASFSSPVFAARCFSVSASPSSQDSSHSTEQSFPLQTLKRTWKPICLYYTQGKCTMMNDSFLLDKFDHNCSMLLEANMSKAEKLRAQQVDYFLVLDLEGKVEILEFPVMMINAKTMHVVDLFHRFVRPSKLSKKRIDEYIEGKYGKLGVDRVWHDTAMSFTEVIQEFEAWICGHNLWEKELGGPLTRAAFVTWVSTVHEVHLALDAHKAILLPTCAFKTSFAHLEELSEMTVWLKIDQICVHGNWDIKTKIPQQCQVCRMQIPPYFLEWINLKDIYLNFYNRRASGMKTMLNELNIPLLGRHHLGIDDTKNISRVVQRMLADGALLQITARRNPRSLENVEYLFENRIR